MEQSNNKPDIEVESATARSRRTALQIKRPTGPLDDSNWALCLSGGGIRSATFCLGVLQGLAATPATRNTKSQHDAPSPCEADSTLPRTSDCLLAQFDFLSTVSGGGYVGSFFTSLFVPGRLAGPKDEEGPGAYAGVAERAYRALKEEPPGRMRTGMIFDPARPGACALAWLRDNGRYLAPSGAGDMAYAAAIAVRNWLATQFVVATIVLPVLALGLFLRLAAVLFADFQPLEVVEMTGFALRWSSTWYLAIGIITAAAAPLGIGYWFCHPREGQTLASPAHAYTLASLAATVVGLVCLGVAAWQAALEPDQLPQWALLLGVVGSLALAAVLCQVLTFWLGQPGSVSAHRVLMSRGLSRALLAWLAIAGLAAVETLAMSIVQWVAQIALPTSALIAGLVYVVRFVAARLDKKEAPAKRMGIPLSISAGLVASILWLTVATLLDISLLWVVSNGQPQASRLFSLEGAGHAICTAGWTTLALLTLAVIIGRYPGFINLSTFQPLYSARLIRTFLGASNFERFKVGSPAAHSVAEPQAKDSIAIANYYKNPLAPIHFVNVCLNQTAGPDAQLVQRDRKGKPLVIAPGGFYVDGQAHCFKEDGAAGGGDLSGVLTVGEWIGVSGAAFTTGLGRSTSLGVSLLLGFANVRLGRWWPSGMTDGRPHFAGLLRRCFKTQAYLLDEMQAKFHGTRLPLSYISDGGHFENTALYEMLRPQRQVGVLVVCDCGADPNYDFEDLANLIRLARIDHQLEVRINRQAAQHPKLGKVFSTPQEIKLARSLPGAQTSEQCALLLDVFSCAAQAVVARIVLLKPVLISSAPADVATYQASKTGFPQEATSDQFFDEAQWESYRQLGLQVCRAVFPRGADREYDEAFWEHVGNVRRPKLPAATSN